MTMVKTRVQAGRVELAVPSDWPNGMEVEIRPVIHHGKDDDPMSPEEIARVLAGMDAMQPLELSEEELKRSEERIYERKRRDKEAFAQRMENLKKGWD